MATGEPGRRPVRAVPPGSLCQGPKLAK
ncbi:hypothetical protein SCOCK_180206 [Actinacidiphila cocklensis]|uniref:Uncharacterized protein n=1 Tax=Actinacidiphila cocklensis TaxID=887465 RepID=A0A9W4DME3_9ACTN|nr:hypothetical protein SCOCK_180206 [Actinacidiphila cocklensis]